MIIIISRSISGIRFRAYSYRGSAKRIGKKENEINFNFVVTKSTSYFFSYVPIMPHMTLD